MIRAVETGDHSAVRFRESARQVKDSIGFMLRAHPCPKGEVGVSKHETAPSFETRSFGALLRMGRRSAQHTKLRSIFCLLGEVRTLQRHWKEAPRYSSSPPPPKSPPIS